MLDSGSSVVSWSISSDQVQHCSAENAMLRRQSSSPIGSSVAVSDAREPRQEASTHASPEGGARADANQGTPDPTKSRHSSVLWNDSLVPDPPVFSIQPGGWRR
jgi:hypothetical protein